MRPAAILELGASTATVLARRAKLGPRRASWSFAFETLVEGLRILRRKTERLPIEEQRRTWDAMALPSPALKAVRFEEAPGFPGRSMWCSAPSRREGGPVVFFLHGGAFNFGSIATHGDLVARIALSSGARVLFVDYRRAPEHPFPAALDDASAAYEELARTVDVRRIVFSGDSAGGGLCVSTMLRARAEGRALPAGAALICPWVDLSDENHELDPDDWLTGAWGARFGDAYRATVDRTDPRVSPGRADLSPVRGVALPPMLLQVGTAELLHPQVEVFARKLIQAGVPTELEVAADMVHDWHLLATVHPPARRPFESLGRFVRAATAERDLDTRRAIDPHEAAVQY